MFILGEDWAGEFTLRNPDTGVKSNADSTPTGTLVVNGDDDDATVTITEKETGVYGWAISSTDTADLVRGDRIQVRISATVAGKDDNFDVADDSVDLSTSDLIEALKDGLQAAEITVQSPIVGEKVDLFAKADYAADTVLLIFSSASWPVDLSPGEYDDVQLHARVNGEDSIVGTCSVTASGLPGTQVVTVALTNAETESLGASVDPAAPYKVSLTSSYTLWAIKSGSPDKKWPLSNSTLSVRDTVFYVAP